MRPAALLPGGHDAHRRDIGRNCEALFAARIFVGARDGAPRRRAIGWQCRCGRTDSRHCHGERADEADPAHSDVEPSGIATDVTRLHGHGEPPGLNLSPIRSHAQGIGGHFGHEDSGGGEPLDDLGSGLAKAAETSMSTSKRTRM